jgi:hypothetical protein
MFNSNENKEMIWGLLSEQSRFPLNQQWRNFFEQNIMKIAQKNPPNTNIVEMNKELLSVCMQQINSFSNIKFDEKKTLQKKQQELKILKEGPKRGEIDFSDKDNTEYGNLNLLMDQANANRQKELHDIQSQFSKNEKKASQWLNVPKKIPEIKIDKNTFVEIKNEVIPAGKTVKFNLKDDILKTRAKITYTEHGIEKILYCNISNNFRLFSSDHGKIKENITARIENVELF